MTTPAKSASKPAQKATPASKVAPKKAAPTFDFDSLGEAQAAPAPRRQVGPAVPPNVLAALQDSWSKRERMAQVYENGKGTGRWTYRGEGKAWTVPADVAPVLEATIRRAGVQLGYGTSVRSDEVKQDGKPTGMVRVTFCAKTAKAGKSKTDGTDEK